VATEQGLQAASFDQGARAYQRAVGAPMSGDSVRRITQGFGQAVHEQRTAQVEGVYTLWPAAERHESLVEQMAPIEEQANLSTDGVMMRVRQAGYKEVKLTVISDCQVSAAEAQERRAGRRAKDPLVKLRRHSCQAGLWDADTMARYQYVEGLRRGLDRCGRVSSVNDAAAWILRITQDNFPQAELIVDWKHAEDRVWAVAQEALSQENGQAHTWVEAQLERLWRGQALEVAQMIEKLTIQNETTRQAAGYFSAHASQMHYSEYSAAGYPIGSGTVESGCKNYIQHRMKRPGPGWNPATGQHMLSALSELHSDRFDLAWGLCTSPTNLR
jgi:hypothetical protein